MPLEGRYALFVTSILQATDLLIRHHYEVFSAIADRRKIIKSAERDQQIRDKYTQGVSARTLANEFGLSTKRIYQIVANNSTSNE